VFRLAIRASSIIVPAKAVNSISAGLRAVLMSEPCSWAATLYSFTVHRAISQSGKRFGNRCLKTLNPCQDANIDLRNEI
jgi:hypothetical protein